MAHKIIIHQIFFKKQTWKRIKKRYDEGVKSVPFGQKGAQVMKEILLELR